ncbi:531_t:CDS:1, partial [Ambispora leptoticha]
TNTKTNNAQITFNQQIISNIPPDQAFRFLGCWFSRTLSHKPTHTIITDEITAALRKLRHAKITDKQAIYIINSVILTRFAYRIQNTSFSSSQLDKITKSYTNLAKHKAGFASTIPSSTLFHNRIYSLKTTQNTQQLQHINNFIKILNHPSFGISALKIQLQQLQNSAATNLSILTYQPTFPTPESKTTTAQIVLELHKAQLTLHNDSNIWPILMNQTGTSINNILYSNSKASVIKRKLNTHHIYFIEQLTNHSHTQFLTWQESHPKKFRTLCDKYIEHQKSM